MELIADAAQWAWLRDRCTVQNWSTGIELADFPDHCWILHAAYENPASDPLRARCAELDSAWFPNNWWPQPRDVACRP